MATKKKTTKAKKAVTKKKGTAKKKTTAKKTTKAKKAAKGTAVKKKVAAKPRKESPKMTTKAEKELSPAEVEEYRKLLLMKRAEILGDVDTMQNGALDGNRQDGSGELSTMPIHMADVGTDNYEQEFTLGLIESERKNLKEIDLALNKIEDGTYGTCEVTGQFIGRARLTAKPEARFHIEVARKIEQGMLEAPDIESDNGDGKHADEDIDDD